MGRGSLHEKWLKIHQGAAGGKTALCSVPQHWGGSVAVAPQDPSSDLSVSLLLLLLPTNTGSGSPWCSGSPRSWSFFASTFLEFPVYCWCSLRHGHPARQYPVLHCRSLRNPSPCVHLAAAATSLPLRFSILGCSLCSGWLRLMFNPLFLLQEGFKKRQWEAVAAGGFWGVQVF